MMIRTYRSRERGMSAIPFVVALLLVLIMGGLWASQYSDNEGLRTAATKARQNEKLAQEQFSAVNSRLIDLGSVVGWVDAEGKPVAEQIKAAMAGALDKWREKFTVEFSADKYTATGQGGAIEKLQGDKVRVVYLPAKDQVSVTNLQSLFPLYENAAARMLHDVKRHVEVADAEAKSKVTQASAYKTSLDEKDAARATAQAQSDQMRRSLDEQIRDLRDQVQAKDQQIQQGSTELETVKAESARTIADLQSRILQQVAEIRTLVTREQPFASEGPDGAVVGAGAGVAVINRGKKDMLMAGTKFTVLGRVKGGDLVPKGTLEVVTCRDENADCRILADSPSNPIAGGDLIQSPVYSPNRKMRFVLIGDFRKMGRSQAEARLRQLGASVDTQVSPETHYLVVGAIENAEENDDYKRAIEYGVTRITESQLASFTMY